jgi:predicted nucleotidyltransferase
MRVDGMILFGSRARGDWLLSSDADLMIVSPDFGGLRFPNRSAEVLRHWRGRVDLEVFCYTPGEIAMHGRGVGIIAQALKEGRRI